MPANVADPLTFRRSLVPRAPISTTMVLLSSKDTSPVTSRIPNGLSDPLPGEIVPLFVMVPVINPLPLKVPAITFTTALVRIALTPKSPAVIEVLPMPASSERFKSYSRVQRPLPLLFRFSNHFASQVIAPDPSKVKVSVPPPASIPPLII
ncbi:hypothetical protein ES708_14723 [subsurface metagenome]